MKKKRSYYFTYKKRVPFADTHRRGSECTNSQLQLPVTPELNVYYRSLFQVLIRPHATPVHKIVAEDKMRVSFLVRTFVTWLDLFSGPG